MEHEVAISVVRNTLGMAVRQVAHTGEPVIIRRYKRADVILVPLQEWRRLQRLEADFALAKFIIDDPEDDKPSLIKESA